MGKRNHKLTNAGIKYKGPSSILTPTYQAMGIRGSLVPLSGQRWSVFSLSDSQSLLCTCRPSYYIMNFDKPISQPGSQEEDVFLLDDYTMRSNIF